jgi:flagellar hook-basal body complex protein FliE
MNALSALQPLTPGVRPLPPAGPPPAALPLREMTDLAPMFTPQPTQGPAQTPPNFSDLLGRLVGEVNAKQAAAGATVRALLGGENVPLHQAMIAMEEASLSFHLMTEVRNKLLESYQELMRMQI